MSVPFVCIIVTFIEGKTAMFANAKMKKIRVFLTILLSHFDTYSMTKCFYKGLSARFSFDLSSLIHQLRYTQLIVTRLNVVHRYSLKSVRC